MEGKIRFLDRALSWELIRALGLGAGVLLCFRGYSTVRWVLAVSGFLVGVGAVALSTPYLPVEPTWLIPLLGLGLGVVTSILIVRLYRVGVFAVGAISAIVLAQAFAVYLPADQVQRLLIFAAAGLVGGFASSWMEKLALSAATATVGAHLVLTSILDRPPEDLMVGEPMEIGAVLVLALAGAVVQLRSKSQEKEVE